MAQISVIIPVYNSANKLRDCIESVLGQKNPNFELILIDDGSIDESLDICTSYSTKDKRIRVFHQENSGVSVARNLGLEKATGNWICFIDSDDWVESDYLSFDFKDEYKEISLILHNVVINHTNGNPDFMTINLPKFEKINAKDAIMNHRLLERGFPFAKIFRKSIIDDHNLRFNPKLSLHEDHLFVLNYYLHVKTIAFTGRTTYHYIIDNTVSTLSSRRHESKEMLYASKELRGAIDKLVNKHSITDKRTLCSVYTNFSCRQLSLALLNCTKENCNEIVSEIKKKRSFIIKYYRPKNKKAWLLYAMIFLGFPSKMIYYIKK